MPRFRVVAAFAAVYLIWGSTYLAIRWVVESVPPFLGAGARFLCAGALLYLWRRSKGGPPPSPRQWRTAFVVGSTLMVGGNGMVCWAQQTVPSGAAALIVATMPLWAAVFGTALAQERLPARGWAGLALGFGGVAALVGPERLGGSGRIDPWGAAALLIAAASWAFGSLYARQASEPARPLMATSLAMLAGGTILIAIGGVTGEFRRLDLAAVPLRSWLALGYLVVFGSIITLSAYMWLLHEVAPSRVTTYAYVNPVVAVLLGWLVAGEALDARIGLATLVIVIGVALILTAKAGVPEPALER